MSKGGWPVGVVDVSDFSGGSPLPQLVDVPFHAQRWIPVSGCQRFMLPLLRDRVIEDLK